MPEHDKDLSLLCIDLAIKAWTPDMPISLVALACEAYAFVQGENVPTHHDHQPKWAHDLIRGFVVLSQKVSAMSANSDAAAAAALTLAASVDAALAAGIGTGGAIPPDVAADAAALPVATQAMTDQAARLTAATPAPVV